MSRNENSHKPALGGLSQPHLETLPWVGCGYKERGNELRPFLPPPHNCCWCKSRRNKRPRGGLEESESRLRRTDSNKRHVGVGALVSNVACAGQKARDGGGGGRGGGQVSINFFLEERTGGCCAMAPLTAGAVDRPRNYPEREQIAPS